MHCSNLKAHLFELHVSDDPECICSNGIEDNYHFFLDCSLYYTNRLKLQNIVNNTQGQFTLDTLLYGDTNLDFHQNCIIFEAIHDFIINSGRFN